MTAQTVCVLKHHYTTGNVLCVKTFTFKVHSRTVPNIVSLIYELELISRRFKTANMFLCKKARRHISSGKTWLLLKTFKVDITFVLNPKWWFRKKSWHHRSITSLVLPIQIKCFTMSLNFKFMIHMSGNASVQNLLNSSKLRSWHYPCLCQLPSNILTYVEMTEKPFTYFSGYSGCLKWQRTWAHAPLGVSLIGMWLESFQFW